MPNYINITDKLCHSINYATHANTQNYRVCKHIVEKPGKMNLSVCLILNYSLYCRTQHFDDFPHKKSCFLLLKRGRRVALFELMVSFR